MTVKEYIWACDPIGSLLFITSATLMLLALNWAGGDYAWANPHVVAPLTVGCVLLVVFAVYGKYYLFTYYFEVAVLTQARMERTK